MSKVFKKSYRFLSGIFFVRDLVALFITFSGYVILGKLDEVFKDFYWLSWALLITTTFVTYLLFIRGVISFYPRPEFKDDFRTISNGLRNYMSDSTLFVKMNNVVNYGKIPKGLNDDIYKIHEQLQSNPIRIRSVRLRLKYLNFDYVLKGLVQHLEEHYFLEGEWYVTKSNGASQTELKSVRLKTQKFLKRLSISYSKLLSETSHLGGNPFEVHLIYTDGEN